MLQFLNPSDYKVSTDDENVKSFADMLPQNKLLWTAKSNPESNLYKLYKAYSQELARFQALQAELANTYIPNSTTSIIENWEQFLGIPDDCFDNDGSDDIRRRNILIKLAYMNIQTESDVIALGAILGLVVEIIPASTGQGFPYIFPFQFYNPYITTINISGTVQSLFPYTFPLVFGEGDSIPLFQCLMNKQKPAHIELQYTFSDFEYISNAAEEYVDNDSNPYVGGASV